MKINERLNTLYSDQDYLNRSKIIILFWSCTAITLTVVIMTTVRFFMIGQYFFPAYYLLTAVSILSIYFILKKKYNISKNILGATILVSSSIGIINSFMRLKTNPYYGNPALSFVIVVILFFLFYFQITTVITIFFSLLAIATIYFILIFWNYGLFNLGQVISFYMSLIMGTFFSVMMVKHIQNFLNEKNTLLKEIHHRVKNNLEVINSLLAIQSRSFKDEEIKKEFNSAISKINAISFVHEEHYSKENLHKIDIRIIIDNVASQLCHLGNARDFRININNNIQDIYLNLEKSVPLAIMINELIINSINYSSEYKEDITINIYSEIKKDKMRIVYNDSRKNISPNFDLLDRENPEFKIIHILSEQIDCAIYKNKEEQHELVIECPLNHFIT